MDGHDARARRPGASEIIESTDCNRAEMLADAQRKVLELAVQDAPLEELLNALVETVDTHSSDGVIGSILLIDRDGRHLRDGAGPSLPRAYRDAIDGVEIGPSVGSCGTAAHRNESVAVRDIATDPLWADFRELALGHGLSSCWSTPIRSAKGKLLGTFAMYYREPREPAPEDLKLVDTVTRSAALIIERRLSQDALQDSERRFRALFEHAGVGMIEMDANWRILGANRVYSTITGYSTEELIGQSSLAFTHPDDIARSEEAIRAVRAGETPGITFEKRYIRKDGEIVWIRSNVASLGEGNRFLKIVEDIDEAKKTEEELARRSDEMFALAENIPTLAWMAYADGHIFWYNRRWYEYTGTTPESQEGWGWQSVHDPAVLPGVLERWNHSLSTGEPFEMIFPLKGADGEFRPFLTRMVPIRDEHGEILRWFGTNVDISAQVLAEARLREETHNLEILNCMGSALAGELELEKVVQMATDAGVELTGAEFGAFFYNVINEQGEAYTLYTLSGADRSQFDKFGMPRNTKVFGPTFRGEGIVRSDDITKDPRYGQNPPHYGKPKGHLPVVSYLAVPVIGRQGEVVGGLFFGHPQPARFKERHERLMEGIAAQAAIAIDNARLFRSAQDEIDRRMKAEQALTALNETLESRVHEEVARRSNAEEALRQSQKMETVGQLSGGIAHDFNNLLQIIHGNLSLLQRSLPPEEKKWHRSVANALTGTERAASLTQRLLAFSRRQPLDPKPVDVNGMIDEMIELFHRTLGETIVIETKLDPEVPAARADPNQLENALLNLAINARDAMPGGGRLEIATDKLRVEKEAEQFTEASPGDYVRISVSDTGCGMSPDVLSRAIEPFFSTKEVGQGTGLGLSTVYGFVKQSGGNLLLTSKEGEGTRAEILLPVSTMAAGAESGPHTRPELPRGNGERILVCEDDEDVRSFSLETLRDLGYEVVEAPDAESALSALRENGGVDLLFTDIVLPGGKTGADLAREAKALQPDLKVLFTTGYARSALDGQDRDVRVVEVLRKPFGVDALATRLRTMLDA